MIQRIAADVRRAMTGETALRRSSIRRRNKAGFAPRWLFAAAAASMLGLSITSSEAAVRRDEIAASLDVAYTATLFGLPIGHINWKLEIKDSRFSASANGATAGLLQIFSPGHGIAKASGTLLAERPGSLSFLVRLTHGSASQENKVLFVGDKAREIVTPPPPPNPNIVPLSAASRSGVIDPMTALLILVPGTGSTAVPAACDRTIAVFDGRMRYDLRLAYKRLEQVKAQAGYEGPAVVCAAYFEPLAGYDPTRYAIRYLRAERGMEIWLAPLNGSRLLVPFRISVPTPIGLGVLQATRFIWSGQHGGSGMPKAD